MTVKTNDLVNLVRAFELEEEKSQEVSAEAQAGSSQTVATDQNEKAKKSLESQKKLIAALESLIQYTKVLQENDLNRIKNSAKELLLACTKNGKNDFENKLSSFQSAVDNVSPENEGEKWDGKVCKDKVVEVAKVFSQGSWVKAGYYDKLYELSSLAEGIVNNGDKTEKNVASGLQKAISDLANKVQEDINKIDLKDSGKRKHIFEEATVLVDATSKFITVCKDEKQKPGANPKENFQNAIKAYNEKIKDLKMLKDDPTWKRILAAVVGAVIGFFAGLFSGILTGPGVALTATAGAVIGGGVAGLAGCSMFQSSMGKVQKQAEKFVFHAVPAAAVPAPSTSDAASAPSTPAPKPSV